MIKFRLGQSWKREPAGAGGAEPQDAFAFEVDGVNLLGGANDEPLVHVVSGLVDAVAALVVDGDPAGQLSLEDVRLEVCFWRRPGLEVEVMVVSLAQPPRQVRPAISVELPALVEATAQCARAFLRDVHAQRSGQEGELASLERRLKALVSTVVAEHPPRRVEPWTAAHPDDGGLGYTLHDVEGRTTSFSRRSRAGLPALLVDGEVTATGASQAGLPFLTMMGLARAATEGKVALSGRPLDPIAVFNAGLDVCLALRARSPALAGNPWLEALQVRCADGLKALRQPVPDVSSASVSAPRATPGTPIAATGQVRRVALAAVWSRPVALGEDGGRLVLGKKGILVSSAHAAHAFTLKGETAFRRLAPRGVGASPTLAVCAWPTRTLLFDGADESASWMKDHDGAQLGPGLHQAGDVLVTALARRGVVGLSASTGRELWRFAPQRTQRSFVTVLGPRVLVATDEGALYGVDVDQGQVRFTVRSPIPCVAAPVIAGRRALVLLNRGEHTALYLCDALAGSQRKPAGAIGWTRELTLSGPRGLVFAGGRAYLAGARDGRTWIIAVGSRGQVLWERTVPLEAHTTSLVPWDKGVLATDARGAAVRLLPDGQPTWVLGGFADQLSAAIAPSISRHVLVVPGPGTRLVDLVSGRVLAELDTGARVTDLVVDRKLTLYVLKEPGVLEAWRPGTVLALVGAGATSKRTSRSGA